MRECALLAESTLRPQLQVNAEGRSAEAELKGLRALREKLAGGQTQAVRRLHGVSVAPARMGSCWKAAVKLCGRLSTSPTGAHTRIAAFDTFDVSTQLQEPGSVTWGLGIHQGMQARWRLHELPDGSFFEVRHPHRPRAVLLPIFVHQALAPTPSCPTSPHPTRSPLLGPLSNFGHAHLLLPRKIFLIRRLSLPPSPTAGVTPPISSAELFGRWTTSAWDTCVPPFRPAAYSVKRAMRCAGLALLGDSAFAPRAELEGDNVVAVRNG